MRLVSRSTPFAVAILIAVISLVAATAGSAQADGHPGMHYGAVVTHTADGVTVAVCTPGYSGVADYG